MEQFADLAALCTALCFFQSAQFVLGCELLALGLGHDFGTGHPRCEIIWLPLLFFGRYGFLVRQIRLFLLPPLYANPQNGVVSPILAQRVRSTHAS